MKVVKVLFALFLFYVSAALFFGIPHGGVVAAPGVSTQASHASCVNETDLYSLVESIEHAEASFLFPIEGNTLGQHAWWNALVGVNNSLGDPFSQKGLRETVLRLRENGRVSDEFTWFMRPNTVTANSNARDFFRFLSYVCANDRAFALDPIRASLERALWALNDRYTYYMDPIEARRHRAGEEVALESSGGAGIGVLLAKEEGSQAFTVVGIKRGSPADVSGLAIGDTLLRIGETPTFILSLEQATERLRGELGSTVTITIERKANGEMSEILLTRDFEIVSLEMIDPCAALVRIESFESRHTAESFRAKLEYAAKMCPLPNLIVDLRGNRGGLLYEAVEAADALLPEGNIVITETQTGERTFYVATNDNEPVFEDVVVLVDMGTASAAEILAAALVENDAALLVGKQHTYGKGVGQMLYPLANGGIAKITALYVFPPSGRSFHGVGLYPAVGVPTLRTEDILGLIDAEDREFLERFGGDNGLRVAYEHLGPTDTAITQSTF